MKTPILPELKKEEERLRKLKDEEQNVLQSYLDKKEKIELDYEAMIQELKTKIRALEKESEAKQKEFVQSINKSKESIRCYEALLTVNSRYQEEHGKWVE